MRPPCCKVCGAEEWLHICTGSLVARLAREREARKEVMPDPRHERVSSGHDAKPQAPRSLGPVLTAKPAQRQMPEMIEIKPLETEKKDGKFDKKGYQREYMRRIRARAKEKIRGS